MKILLQSLVDRQLFRCELGNYEYIVSSNWLYDVSASELKRLYGDYKARAIHYASEIAQKYGECDYQSEFFASWYSEVVYGQAWNIGEKVLFIAVEHQDRETPISLVVGVVNLAEIDIQYSID